ncbi:MAG TPA: PEFG-CTERM sorting domain-containing protein [Nitrosopumilaceae archaeon]|nr:PEFG-CTERM sorting domain-containing protein [Nitrosopumilaceae archaeon]
MKAITLGSFFVLFAIVVGLSAPTAFADHPNADVSIALGSGVPGCEETDECYIPATVTVSVGGEVTWSNDDTAPHTVTAGNLKENPDTVGTSLPNGFDSGMIMSEETFEHTFDTEGTFDYFCMVHPWMVGTVIVEAEGAGGEGLMVDIQTTQGKAGQTMDITVTFTEMGKSVEHVNYNIKATQDGKTVLDDTGVHDHDGKMTHKTMALPAAASDAKPVNVNVEFLGFGINEPFTGPIGEVATKKIVPEFGTIAMMILGVAIVSIIAISAKSRVIPKL